MSSGNYTENDCLRAITSTTLVGRRDLLFAWAGQVGATVSGGESETDLFKKIVLTFGATQVGNWSETDCLRYIAAASGATSPGSLSSLDCLKFLVDNGSGGTGSQLQLLTEDGFGLLTEAGERINYE